jgi:EAL domain-containing protein (putative c-di-GMP-specific phosphodiesterase class I)
MLEQKLINAFMKFTSRAGAGEFIKDLVQQTEQNGNPKSWTLEELNSATNFLNLRAEQFSQEDAVKVITTLMRKHNISASQLGTITEEKSADSNQPLSGTTGLQ